MPWQKDGCSLAYHTLLEYLSVSEIVQWNSTLAESCLMAMNDRGLASEVGFSFFLFFLKIIDLFQRQVIFILYYVINIDKKKHRKMYGKKFG